MRNLEASDSSLVAPRVQPLRLDLDESGDDRPRVSRAIVLAGSPGTALCPLGNCFSKLDYPVLGRPFADHLLDLLQQMGIEEVLVVSPDGGAVPIDGARGPARRWTLRHERNRDGTAGCLRHCHDFVGAEPFLLLNPGVLPTAVDLLALTAAHLRTGAALSVLVERAHPFSPRTDRVYFDGQQRVQHVSIAPGSSDGSAWSCSGAYVVDPSGFSVLPERGYAGIKEHLVPLLLEGGLGVHAEPAAHAVHHLDCARDYLHMSHQLLTGIGSQQPAGTDFVQCKPGVWVHREAHVDPTARLCAPLLVGRGARVGAHATLTGPVCLGDDSAIAAHARVSDSILWSGARVADGAHLHSSILTRDVIVPAATRVSSAVVIDVAACRGIGPFVCTTSDEHTTLLHRAGTLRCPAGASQTGRRARLVKRTMDLAIDIPALCLLAPLMLVLALLIKLDSRGPVLFRQRRCGRGGRPFTLCKFRTMYTAAEQERRQIGPYRPIGAPVVKTSRDPRVTRLGHLLRRTSLDELPNLFNVLVGSLSLVGPRPLAAAEMSNSPAWRDIRLMVKPGVTGLWQISGRSNLPFRDWIHYDIDYVRCWSVRRDLWILLKTVQVVLQRTGAR